MERRNLRKRVSLETPKGEKPDTCTPFSRFAFVDIEVDAIKLGPKGPFIPEIRVDGDSEGYPLKPAIQYA